MPLYLRTLIAAMHSYLVYLNINLIAHKKFRMPRPQWFFRLRNLIRSRPLLLTYIGSQQWRWEYSSNFFFLFQSHYTTEVQRTLKIIYPWNQLVIVLFARLLNLFCLFLKLTVLHYEIGPLLILHLFYGFRCHFAVRTSCSLAVSFYVLEWFWYLALN